MQYIDISLSKAKQQVIKSLQEKSIWTGHFLTGHLIAGKQQLLQDVISKLAFSCGFASSCALIQSKSHPRLKSII